MDNLTKLSMTINFEKVNMNWLYKGHKGNYMTFTIYLRDKTDQYGNTGFVSQSASQEAYKAGERGQICGNIKSMGLPPNAVGYIDIKNKTSEDAEDDIPF